MVAEFAAETASVMDVLEHFACRMDLAHLLEVIPAMKPRLYSIASSQKTMPQALELCIVENTWTTAKGVKKVGLCTGYLDSLDLSNGPVQVAVSVTSGALAMPADSKAPILMAGLGTGIAPFRAFVEEKAVQKKSGKEIGEVAFLMGLRYRSKEYLFKEEFEELEKEGAVVTYFDPWVKEYKYKGQVRQSIPALTEQVLKDADLVMVTTAHTNVDYDMVQKNAALIFDSKNAMKNIQNRDNIEVL